MLFILPLLVSSALVRADANTPPYNSSATNPWWPEYPEGRDEGNYMLSESATDADLRGETDVAKWLVQASNMWRAQFGSVPITWNETSARIAQAHSNSCVWEHWGSDNLAQQYGSNAAMRFDIRSMTALWADEWDYYPFNHPEEEAFSHFTAMTWNASTTVGCGWNVWCQNSTEWPSKTFFVCNYYPQPNLLSKPPGVFFAQNVKNYTGWAVNDTKLSSIKSLAAQGPTNPVLIYPSASATGTAGAGGDGPHVGGVTNSNNNNGQAVGVTVSAVLSSMLIATLFVLRN